MKTLKTDLVLKMNKLMKEEDGWEINDDELYPFIQSMEKGKRIKVNKKNELLKNYCLNKNYFFYSMSGGIDLELLDLGEYYMAVIYCEPYEEEDEWNEENPDGKQLSFYLFKKENELEEMLNYLEEVNYEKTR